MSIPLGAAGAKNRMSLVCAKLQFGKGEEVAATFCNTGVTVVLCKWGVTSYVIQCSGDSAYMATVRWCACVYVCMRVRAPPINSEHDK
jgi:hypothetical protein